MGWGKYSKIHVVIVNINMPKITGNQDLAQ